MDTNLVLGFNCNIAPLINQIKTRSGMKYIDFMRNYCLYKLHMRMNNNKGVSKAVWDRVYKSFIDGLFLE